MYLVKTPRWLKLIYRNYFWDLPVSEKVLFLTFDDGPHPVATPFVLEELAKFNAKATFFCIGKNVEAHSEIFQKISGEGHGTGNHTHNHLNGWKCGAAEYLQNVEKATEFISSKLFRPPYGRIRKKQGRQLKDQGFKIIMWDVLSGDFDRNISKEQCLHNVISNTRPGSIIVFHDSEKAFPHLKFVLPRALEHFGKLGYKFEAIMKKGPE